MNKQLLQGMIELFHHQVKEENDDEVWHRITKMYLRIFSLTSRVQ